jgi:hypothetical protein
VKTLGLKKGKDQSSADLPAESDTFSDDRVDDHSLAIVSRALHFSNQFSS